MPLRTLSGASPRFCEVDRARCRRAQFRAYGRRQQHHAAVRKRDNEFMSDLARSAPDVCKRVASHPRSPRRHVALCRGEGRTQRPQDQLRCPRFQMRPRHSGVLLRTSAMRLDASPCRASLLPAHQRQLHIAIGSTTTATGEAAMPCVSGTEAACAVQGGCFSLRLCDKQCQRGVCCAWSVCYNQ